MCKLMEDMRNEASGKSEYNKSKKTAIFFIKSSRQAPNEICITSSHLARCSRESMFISNTTVHILWHPQISQQPLPAPYPVYRPQL